MNAPEFEGFPGGDRTEVVSLIDREVIHSERTVMEGETGVAAPHRGEDARRCHLVDVRTLVDKQH